jgi:hypothetical protein
VTGDLEMGLESLISGPFFIGRLVGVGFRLIDLGSSLGTLEPMPMCAYQAHIRVASTSPLPSR